MTADEAKNLHDIFIAIALAVYSLEREAKEELGTITFNQTSIATRCKLIFNGIDQLEEIVNTAAEEKP